MGCQMEERKLGGKTGQGNVSESSERKNGKKMLQWEMKGQSEQAKWIGHESQTGKVDGRYEDYKDILVNKTVCVFLAEYHGSCHDGQNKIMTHWSLKSFGCLIKPVLFFLLAMSHTLSHSHLPSPPPQKHHLSLFLCLRNTQTCPPIQHFLQTPAGS